MPTIPSAITKCAGTAALISQDASINTLPVQQVLRPAIGNARHNTEQVLHAQRYSRPMVCLHLGHRDDEVARQDRPWEPQPVESSEGSLQRHLPDLVAIQIYEPDPPRLSSSSNPLSASTSRVSRWWPGPSPTTTVFAPSARNALAAAPTSRGSVFTSVPGMDSTRFGFSRTVLPRRSQIEQPKAFNERTVERSGVGVRMENRDAGSPACADPEGNQPNTVAVRPTRPCQRGGHHQRSGDL